MLFNLYFTELYVDLQHAARRDIRRVQWFDKRVLPQMQDSLSTGYCVRQGRRSCQRPGGKPDERYWTAMRRCGVKLSTENKRTILRFYREVARGSFKLVEHWNNGLKRWPASRKLCSRIFNTYSRMLKTRPLIWVELLPIRKRSCDTSQRADVLMNYWHKQCTNYMYARGDTPVQCADNVHSSQCVPPQILTSKNWRMTVTRDKPWFCYPMNSLFIIWITVRCILNNKFMINSRKTWFQ